MSEHAHLTADQARAALAGADTARRGLAARGRWLATYFATFAVGSVVVVSVIGLVPGPVGVSLAMAAWVVLISVCVSWAARRPVRLRSEGRLHALAWGSWAVVYGVVLVTGESLGAGPSYWLPAAVVTAVPLAACAVLALRWSRR
ncbi:hypothetical protein ACUN7V_05390 [Quadrisphaera oryzae]|uniref:hypothetical protein n=1 Tax=Quadrisphaera TaxID=317661 RepID=UPI0016474738|nr:hypothetical protein [Quadrisphaera sp. RL12-1S]MBC3761394.1 hypothetical protein [Quadrisphaera sp. RL12-1S]